MDGNSFIFNTSILYPIYEVGDTMIVLLKGETTLNKSEYEFFEKGSTIFDIGSFPKELKIWDDEYMSDAKEYLKTCRCKYIQYPHCIDVQEYALEYYDCNGVCYIFADVIEKQEKF